MGTEDSHETNRGLPGLDRSKEFVGRLFYFRFAVHVSNTRLLVALLVQIGLDVEHRYEPRATAKRFLNLARKSRRTWVAYRRLRLAGHWHRSLSDGFRAVTDCFCDRCWIRLLRPRP